MIESWVIIPDLQVPLHHAAAVKKFQSFIKDYQPTGLACVGDELDATQISKWVSGKPGEYEGSFQEQVDQTHTVLNEFRKALGPNKKFYLSRSNHGETRVMRYVNDKAPALRTLRGLEYEELLGLKKLDITYLRQPTEIFPNTLLCHGDEGSMIQTPGGTAMGLAKRWGKSVIAGHTHKLGYQHDNSTVNGAVTRHLFGLEVGHLMSFGDGSNSASYLKAGSANWQAGFGIVKVDRKKGIVQPILVPIDLTNRRFVVENTIYSW
jgi:UDP-2,3-diacylglucosamine pyrophosphatase LpxH